MRFFGSVLSFFLLISWAASAQPSQPRRAMILVFDQMRAEYIERFDLPNFQRAQALGLNFDNGYVGHLESNTIISHPVITTGKLPRNMPWSAQVMRDSEGWLGRPGGYYMPARLTPDQWWSLHRRTSGDTSLPARIRKVNDGPSFAVAQKAYAAYNFGGPYVDTVIALGSLIQEGPFRGYHSITGVNVPESIARPVGNRFTLEGTNRWGSEVERYALKGSGYVRGGDDPLRVGGDAWVGDVVEHLMEREPEWSVILASFGAIDKVSHVLAEHDGPTGAEWAVRHGINLENTLREADRELGRILDRLASQGLMEETVLVITADHGGQRNSHFHGRLTPGRHQQDSYWGLGENFDFREDPNPHLQPLIDTGWLEAATIDTMGLFWTKPLTPVQGERFVELLGLMPGVAEVYAKKADGSYRRAWRSDRLKGRELAWARQHHADLVSTLGGERGPEFLVALFDNHGYAMVGAHGGTQELLQRIPLIVVSPNLDREGHRSKAWVRLVDVNPIVGRLMGLPPHPGLDGTAEAVEPFLLR